MESRPAEYNRPVCLSSWSAFTPDLWRGSSSSLITNDMVTFRLGMAWLWGWPWEWPEDGRIPAAILHLPVTTFVTRSTRFQSKSARVSRALPIATLSYMNVTRSQGPICCHLLFFKEHPASGMQKNNNNNNNNSAKPPCLCRYMQVERWILLDSQMMLFPEVNRFLRQMGSSDHVTSHLACTHD